MPISLALNTFVVEPMKKRVSGVTGVFFAVELRRQTVEPLGKRQLIFRRTLQYPANPTRISLV